MTDADKMYLHIMWNGPDQPVQTRELLPHEVLCCDEHAWAWAESEGVVLNDSNDVVPSGMGDVTVTLNFSPDPHAVHIWQTRDYYVEGIR